MVWVIKLEKVVEGKVISCRKVMTLERPENIQSLEDLGLRLEDGKCNSLITSGALIDNIHRFQLRLFENITGLVLRLRLLAAFGDEGGHVRAFAAHEGLLTTQAK